MRSRFGLVGVLAVLLASSVGIAQEITGSIRGTVSDSTGAVVPNATVTIKNVDTNLTARTLKTDAGGNYAVPLLPIGHYQVTVEAPGFKKVVQSGIELNVNDKLTISPSLQVGSVTEAVQVEASAVQVELQSPTAAGLVSGRQIRELSLNNRNYEQLLSLVPGVASTASDQLYVGTTNPLGTNTVTFSINGGRTSANNWMVDGADNVDRGSNLTLLSYPSVDAIAEFKVLRGQYDAEFGRSAAGQINVVTRSGTSTFHGGAYEFWRNDILNANNFFNKRQPDPSKWTPRPALRYHDFGWTLGGPVYIPRVYNRKRDKTFFFFSQEWRRIITYSNQTAVVATAGERGGVFVNPVCTAWSGQTCTATGTQIPQATFSPLAAAYLQDVWARVALPNDAFDPHLLRTTYRNVANFREEMVKIDHVFGPRLTINGKILRDTIPTEEPGGLFTGSAIPGMSSTTTNSPGHNYTVRATATLSPSLLIEAGYAYSYGAILSVPVGFTSSAQSPDIVPNLPFPVTLGRIPSVTLTGATGSNVGGFGPYQDYNRNHSAFGNVSKIMGRHAIKAGFTYYHYQKTENAGGGNVGAFTFNQSGKPSGSAATNFEQSWANFLLGHASLFTQDALDLTPDIRTNQIEFFGQDEFRVKPNLTFSYGVRYSLFRQPTDAKGMLTNFDPKYYDPAKAPCINATTGNIDATCNPNYDPLNGILIGGKNSPYGGKVGPEDNKAIAPRIGLAWDPYKNGKMSVRAGYGLFYDAILFGIVEQNIFGNPPFVNRVTIPNTSFDNPASGTPSISAAPKRIGSRVPPDYRAPYSQQWSLDVQQELGRGFLLDIGYYGAKGTHLIGIVDINQPQPGAYIAAGITPQPMNSAGTVKLNAIRPYLGYVGMDAIRTWFNSNYNSLQLQAQKRFSGNSLLNVAYTWSHNLTNNQTDRSTAPQNAYDIKADYGPSQQDRRHIFTANFVYDLPFFKAQKGALGHTLGGWEVTGIVTYQSGVPLTVSSPFNLDPSGQGCLGPSPCAVRPDMISDPNNAPRTLLQWFDVNAFAAVPAGQFRNGNAPRGAVLGPGLGRWDVSLFKNIKFTERITSQLRLESFNAFNHTNYNGVQTSLSSGTKGQIISTRDPRIVQLGLKVNF